MIQSANMWLSLLLLHLLDGILSFLDEVRSNKILEDIVKEAFWDDWVEDALKFVADWTVGGSLVWEISQEAFCTFFWADRQEVFFFVEGHRGRHLRRSQADYVQLGVLVAQGTA